MRDMLLALRSSHLMENKPSVLLHYVTQYCVEKLIPPAGLKVMD